MDASDPKSRFFQRTMHTPDDETRAALRSALREMSRALIPLHRALIEAAKADFNIAVGPVAGAGEMLRLLQGDPFFAWLKPMTTLIVDIDEMARTDFERADADAIASRVEQLVGTTANGDFSKHYLPLLQRDVEVTIGHAAVRQALSKFAK